MSKVHLTKMQEMFLDSKLQLRLELNQKRSGKQLTVMMKHQLPEVEEAEEEDKVLEEVAEDQIEEEVDMEIEILKLPDLTQKETHTLMTQDQKEEEMLDLEEVESMKDSIKETEPEELTEAEEKREELMLELMNL